MISEKVLWFTQRLPRSYFLIPEGVALAPGPLLVRSLRNEQKNVRAADLAPYLISEQKLHTVLKADITHMLEQFPALLAELATEGQLESVAIGDLLAALPPALAFSEADVGTLSEALNGAFAGGVYQGLSPEDFVALVEKQGQEGVVAWVEQLGDWLTNVSEDEDRALFELLNRLEGQLNSLFQSDQPHHQTTVQQRQAYRKSADRAIANSLRKIEFDPLPHQHTEE